MNPRLLPTPRQVEFGPGRLAVGDLDREVAWELVPEARWAAALGPDQRPEAHHIEVDRGGARVSALTPEGLLRAAVTLRQLYADGTLPHCTITDWPLFRYRCAADWLLNCESNRWGYDWGDGPEAYLARVQRKLDFCADHKINQVWFDGLGWDVQRFAGYTELMRACTRYARERGVKLTFAGYGGGYGTSYQTSELYRCGYQGQVFLNRRPWPDGTVYDCCGLGDVPESRRYGTCLSNPGLQAAKLAEMVEFVAAVEPGFMYVHDLDAGQWDEARRCWLHRCDDCRARWPNDELAAPDGQAGAYAAWFAAASERLLAVRTEAYDAAADLHLIFTGPVYTNYDEAGQPHVWDAELEYFRVLSQCLGPRANVLFGLREQFLNPDGSARIAGLRATLDGVRHGHGIHVIAFGGGDNYTSNDLVNVSATLAHLYEGAQSVCVSNGGVHEEPIQVMNAECLWHGSAASFRPDATDQESVARVWGSMCRGTYRPVELFGEEGLLATICGRLWGPEAGKAMWRAYTAAEDCGMHPVSRVWWAVTREVRRLRGDTVHGAVSWDALRDEWTLRLSQTEAMLEHVTAAARLAPGDDDIAWLRQCLAVGVGFAHVVHLSASRRAGDTDELREAANAALRALQALLEGLDLRPTDLLGGDPGCWQETLDHLRELNA